MADNFQQFFKAIKEFLMQILNKFNADQSHKLYVDQRDFMLYVLCIVLETLFRTPRTEGTVTPLHWLISMWVTSGRCSRLTRNRFGGGGGAAAAWWAHVREYWDVSEGKATRVVIKVWQPENRFWGKSDQRVEAKGWSRSSDMSFLKLLLGCFLWRRRIGFPSRIS